MPQVEYYVIEIGRRGGTKISYDQGHYDLEGARRTAKTVKSHSPQKSVVIVRVMEEL